MVAHVHGDADDGGDLLEERVTPIEIVVGIAAGGRLPDNRIIDDFELGEQLVQRIHLLEHLGIRVFTEFLRRGGRIVERVHHIDRVRHNRRGKRIFAWRCSKGLKAALQIGEIGGRRQFVIIATERIGKRGQSVEQGRLRTLLRSRG